MKGLLNKTDMGWMIEDGNKTYPLYYDVEKFNINVSWSCKKIEYTIMVNPIIDLPEDSPRRYVAVIGDMYFSKKSAHFYNAFIPMMDGVDRPTRRAGVASPQFRPDNTDPIDSFRERFSGRLLSESLVNEMRTMAEHYDRAEDERQSQYRGGNMRRSEMPTWSDLVLMFVESGQIRRLTTDEIDRFASWCRNQGYSVRRLPRSDY